MFVAKALLDNRLMDLPFSVPFFKWMRGERLVFSDLKLIDPEFAASMDKMVDLCEKKKQIESNPSLVRNRNPNIFIYDQYHHSIILYIINIGLKTSFSSQFLLFCYIFASILKQTLECRTKKRTNCRIKIEKCQSRRSRFRFYFTGKTQLGAKGNPISYLLPLAFPDFIRGWFDNSDNQ